MKQLEINLNGRNRQTPLKDNMGNYNFDVLFCVCFYLYRF